MQFYVALPLGIVIGAAVYAIVSLILRSIRRKNGKQKIEDAEQEAKQILAAAARDAESKKKDMVLGAKEEILQLRNDAERELKDRRAEVTRMERRLTQKEENLDRKTEQLERKNDQLDAKLRENDALREQIQGVMDQHLKRLEEISGYTAEEAKNELLNRMESETRHEMAQKLDELETEFKEEADTKARNILTLAIQRCAADHVAESTISVVNHRSRGAEHSEAGDADGCGADH